jgi:plastocyanin
MLRVLCLSFMLAAGVLAPAAPAITVSGTAVAKGKPVADAVVWIDAPLGTRSPPRTDAVLEQRDLQFFPRVLAVSVGTHVKFPNDDRVLHNVFSYHDGKPFDLGLYPVGEVKDVPFDRPGLSRIYCNIHSQMAAYVMVVDTPFFAVSDADGRFSLADVPPGTYHYHAWRPGGRMLNGTIAVAPDAPLEVRWP